MASRCLEEEVPPPTPTFDFLKLHGSWTYDTRSQWTSDSTTNWASIFYGNPVTVHGVSSNVFGAGLTFLFRDPSKEEACLFPATMYHAFKSYGAGNTSETSLFTQWNRLHKLNKFAPIDLYVDTDDDKDTEEKAVAYLNAAEHPYASFVYLESLDSTGHSRGWCSKRYRQELETMDRRVGHIIVAAENRAARAGRPFAIGVVSDHGGYYIGHSLMFSKNVLRTPIFFYGSAFAPGNHMTAEPILNIQAVPTLLAGMGFNPPLEWSARPILSALTIPVSTGQGISIEDTTYTDFHMADCEFEYPFYMNMWWSAMVIGAIFSVVFVFCFGYACNGLRNKTPEGLLQKYK